jgi:two-component system, cell cycle response regulator DivK
VPSSSPEIDGAPATATRPPLVLIVDDNERNLRLARDVLLAAGFETLEAATGEEAIALATEHVPDVVLMDLRLPDMEGVEALQILRGHPRAAGIPVVALSALPLESDGGSLGAAGFSGWLEKPIDVRVFPAQVRDYCAPRGG